MSTPSKHTAGRVTLAVVLAVILAGGIYLVVRTTEALNRVNVVAYFDSSNGIYEGDDVVILGVPVGRIEKIEPEPERVKISFWYDGSHKVPADVNAAILSPMLVTSRAIQLTPTYSEGPVLQDNAVIGQDRTVVPVEYDDVREQLHRITETLQPTEPGGVSELGAFINTTADNLRGQGADIRAALVKLSQAVSAVGDHSTDVFSTVKNLSILVSALQDSTDVMRALNQNLASVTGTLADNPDEVGTALQDLSDTIGETINFGILDRDEVVYLDRIEARWPLGLRFSSGSRVPCHCTAIGKIMLALLTPSAQKRVINNLNLSRYTSNTITERKMLISALREVKQRQLGIDDQEFMDGVVCVAVPVTLGNGNCVGAIAMSSPEARMDLKAALEFVPLMRQTVRQLAQSIEPDNGRHQPPM